MSANPLSPDPPLWERYTRARGRVHLTGLQALVRLVLDQRASDSQAGLRTGAFFSGYPGSPLAGLDTLLRSLAPLLTRTDVRFVPGLNEELAASAVAGTQLIEKFPHASHDGVLGVWFGKAPGLDRAIDALRHANFVGASRNGGALAVVGDDPFCKSSSLPSHSEPAFAHACIPLFAPADPGDVLRLGRFAVALSRFSGLWSGLQMVADVADSGRIVELLEPAPEIALPEFMLASGARFAPRIDTHLLPPNVLRIEQELVFGRLEAVQHFARANGLNPITSLHARDRVGIVAAGSLYRELESALGLLGLDEPARERLGLRLLKLDLVWPLDGERVRAFAKNLEAIAVVDTRRAWLEPLVRAALHEGGLDARVYGQDDDRGAPWLARRSEITGGSLAQDLAPWLAAAFDEPKLADRLAALEGALARAGVAPEPSRAPHFCSGCPHSASTVLPEGSLAGGGIGCHTMALLMPEREVKLLGAMGSEGTHWIGLAPYTETRHLFQNLGDGTYFHSGRLAVRACVEAGVPITFKLLWNGVVAMTGGQHSVGAKPLVGVVRDLLTDGVRRVVAMSDDPAVRSLAVHEPRVRVVGRHGWDGAMREIREEPGTTAMIWDELCANEKQRLERRGLRVKPNARIVIDEDVCEGCGDCGVKSSCVSLRPVATALGRKTRIHAGSCSDDRACLDGDCPAFLSVEGTPAVPIDFESLVRWPLPEPPTPEWDGSHYALQLVGIGSTGVVTIDALLVRAAEHDGLYAMHLDQTGLAQRGGKVVSHCVLSRTALLGAPRIEPGCADVLLAFDPLGASDRDTLRALDPSRTRAVAHDLYVPTGADVTSPGVTPREVGELIDPLRAATRSLDTVPAELLAEAALGQVLAANLLLLGYAFQRGLVPLRAASLERAIAENGVAVAANLRAFALGRAVAVEPRLVETLLHDATPPAIGDEDAFERAARALGPAWSDLHEALGAFAHAKDSDRISRRIASHAVDLIDYQGTRLASRYCARVATLARAEAAIDPESLALTDVGARELYRVLAYKDEYEVARLMLRGPHRRWLRRHDADEPRVSYHLHPPLLRALGLKRKLVLGPWVEPLFAVLAALRFTRGTPLDVFGFTRARRLERELARWYGEVLETLGRNLCVENRAEAVEIARLAEGIRGYEEIKAARVEAIRPVVDRKLAALATRG
jgi:indolepyruvate ferredoxin oxidoreductase